MKYRNAQDIFPEELLKQIKEEFEEEYEVSVDYLACDIAKDPKQVYDVCKERGLEVTVLVNNAGFGDYLSFVNADLKKLQDMVDLNAKALMSLMPL